MDDKSLIELQGEIDNDTSVKTVSSYYKKAERVVGDLINSILT